MLQLKPLVAAKAKKNERRGGNKAGMGRQKSADPVETRDELAKAAGVSHDTITRTEYVEKHGSAETKKAVEKGDISLNAAYKRTRAGRHRTYKPGISPKAAQKVLHEPRPVTATHVDIPQDPEGAAKTLIRLFGKEWVVELVNACKKEMDNGTS